LFTETYIIVCFPQQKQKKIIVCYYCLICSIDDDIQ